MEDILTGPGYALVLLPRTSAVSGYGAGGVSVAGLERRFGVTFDHMGGLYSDDPVFFEAAVTLAHRERLP